MRLIIFDCDGTLVDSQNLIVAAMTTAFQRAGLAPLARDKVLSIVGLSLPLAVERLLDAPDRQRAREVSEGYREAFFVLRQNPDLHEPLYPGIAALLDALSATDDVVLGIATGKSRRGVDRVLAHQGLEGRFLTIQTADDHPSKPHPSMIARAMAEAGVGPEHTAMIGDTTYDIEMARAAAVTALGVGWGYHPSDALRAAGAHAVADDCSALARHLGLVIDVSEETRHGR